MILTDQTTPPLKFPPLIQVSDRVLFEPINQAQYDYITATEPNVWFWGNRGGGKSVTARWTCHARALAYPGYRYAILRTSFPELIKNHLIYLPGEMESLGGDFNQAKYIAKYSNGSIGFYMQAETDEQVRNALGIEMMEVVFDEAPTFVWDHMAMISSSVRVAPGVGLTPLKRFNGNPTGRCINDIWKYFIDKDVDVEEDREYRPEEWRSIYIDMRDNTKLDVEAYTKQLGASGLPAHIRKAWLDGEKTDFGQLFEVLKTKVVLNEVGQKVTVPYHVLETLPQIGGKPIVYYDHAKGQWVHPEWVQIYRTIDYGYWPDPAVCLWFAVVGKQCICFKEIVRYKTIIEDFAIEVAAESKGMRVATTYCDPTLDMQKGEDVRTPRDKCEDRGVSMTPSTNNREYYAIALNSALKTEVGFNTPMFQMYQRGCPYLTKSLPQMQYDEKNPLAMADHKHDHAPVAAAYFFMSHIPNTKPAETTRIRPWMKKKPKGR